MDVREKIGFLFEDDLIEEMNAVGQLKKIRKGEVLIHVGDPIRHMPLLLEGAIKVMREDDDGDEFLLYFLERGDTCAMTMNCCMGNSASEIRAVAEKDTTVLLVPVDKMADWMRKYPSWMTFVFDSYNTRMHEMLESIDSLSFMDMHERLYKYLTDKVKVLGDLNLDITHQDIAYDLNTSRVVVSRLLKQLENEGKIRLHRNRIEVLEF